MSYFPKKTYVGCHNLLPYIYLHPIPMPFSVTQVHAIVLGSHWAMGNLVGNPWYIHHFRYTIQICFLRNLQTLRWSNSPNLPDIQAFLFPTPTSLFSPLHMVGFVFFSVFQSKTFLSMHFFYFLSNFSTTLLKQGIFSFFLGWKVLF